MLKYEELRAGEIEKLNKEKVIVVIPVGSLEAHGEHLPVGSDLFQPLDLLEDLSKVDLNLIIAPPIAYGVCYSTQPYKGTVGINHDTMKLLMRDLLQSFYRNGFRLFVVLSGHASSYHLSAIREAVYDIFQNYIDLKIAVLSDYEIAYKLRNKEIPENDGHGGMLETSRIMVYHSNLVGKLPAEYHSTIPSFIIPYDITKYWKTPYEGDPSKASAEFGRSVNQFIEERLLKLFEELRRM